MTVLEAGSYAGDARIDDLAPGEQRLLSYGIDLNVTFDATAQSSNNTIQTGRIVKGVLELTRKNAVIETERLNDEREKQIAEITQEQGRIRDNMRTVDSRATITSACSRSWTSRKTAIEKLQVENAALAKDLEKQQAELESSISGLNVSLLHRNGVHRFDPYFNAQTRAFPSSACQQLGSCPPANRQDLTA